MSTRRRTYGLESLLGGGDMKLVFNKKLSYQITTSYSIEPIGSNEVPLIYMESDESYVSSDNFVTSNVLNDLKIWNQSIITVGCVLRKYNVDGEIISTSGTKYTIDLANGAITRSTITSSVSSESFDMFYSVSYTLGDSGGHYVPSLELLIYYVTDARIE